MSRSHLVTLLAATILLAPHASAQRILSLTGEATEIIYALDSEELLVAVDATSNYPEQANGLPNVGFAGRLSAEALMAFEPTIVLANEQAGPPEVLEQLEATGVQVVRLGSEISLQTPVENIGLIAELVGEQERGQELAADLNERLSAAAARAAALESQPRVLFLYLGASSMQFAGGDETSSNVMIEAAGGVDVGKEVGFVGNAPFTPEVIVTAAPEVLIVTERGMNVMGSVDAVLGIPGVSDTPAAEAGDVIVFEDGYFLNLGLRSPDALIELIEYFESLQ